MASVVSAQTAALTNEVPNAMALTRLKALMVFVLGVGLVASTTGLLVYQTMLRNRP